MNSKKAYAWSATLFLAICLLSCGFPVGKDLYSVNAGSIQLSIGGAGSGESARTIAPDIGGMIAKYRILLKKNGSPDVKAAVTDRRTVISGLEPGIWNVTVSAQSAMGMELATGSADASVAQGSTKAVMISLAAVAPSSLGPTGSLFVKVKLPDTTVLDLVTMPDGDDADSNPDRLFFFGTNAAEWAGADEPDELSEPGGNGDFYQDTSTGLVYEMTNGVWLLAGKLAASASNGIIEASFEKNLVPAGSFTLSMSFCTDRVTNTIHSRLVESVLIYPLMRTEAVLVFYPDRMAFVEAPTPPSPEASLYYDALTREYGYPPQFPVESAKLLPVDYSIFPKREKPILVWTPVEGVYAYARSREGLLIAGYQIEKSINDEPFAPLFEMDAYGSSYLDALWEAGPYTTVYRITAFNLDHYSSAVELTQPAVPNNPTGVSVNSFGGIHRVHWDTVPEYGSTTYNLYAKDTDGEIILLADNVGDVYTFTVEQMAMIAAKTYVFTLSALYDEEESDYLGKAVWCSAFDYGSSWPSAGSGS